MDKKPPASITAAKADAQKPSPQDPWEKIELGATVLYQENKGDGWWECIVVAISKDQKTLTLKWRDYKLYPPLDVKRTKVGLLRKPD